VQITYADAYTDFIFPWNILYPPSGPLKPADPLGFWGARHVVEQVRAGPKCDALSDEPITVMFALDPTFGNSDQQRELFAKYCAAACGRLRITDPINNEQRLFEELVRDPSAHLLYFYCHGYTCNKQRMLRPDGVQLLKGRIEAMRPDSAERQALETLLSLTA